LLREAGEAIAPHRPSLRARFIGWLARQVGPKTVVPLLLAEEANEVKAYLKLGRDSSQPEATQDAARIIARESAEHAGTLAGIIGGNSEPWHAIGSGGMVKSIVYGFNDGLTANFGLVAGVLGASVAPEFVLVSGVAGMIADALSMGSSGYLAAKSEAEVHAHEIAMEREEIRMMPEVEEEELALIYEAKGVSGDRARRMAHEIMADPERMLEVKVREELDITGSGLSPLRDGVVTGSATAVGAVIPVLPFFFLPMPAAIWLSFTISMLAHFGVGAARSFFTGRGIIRSGIDMFVVGLGVAAVGYFIGDLMNRFLM
jgi:VIT1/CCC1 family predicted Fe2+/Mn2+ transporter